jgi:hypothetical protein
MSNQRVTCASINCSQLCTSTCFNLRRVCNHFAEHVVENRILLSGFAFRFWCSSVPGPLLHLIFGLHFPRLTYNSHYHFFICLLLFALPTGLMLIGLSTWVCYASRAWVFCFTLHSMRSLPCLNFWATGLCACGHTLLSLVCLCSPVMCVNALLHLSGLDWLRWNTGLCMKLLARYTRQQHVFVVTHCMKERLLLDDALLIGPMIPSKMPTTTRHVTSAGL